MLDDVTELPRLGDQVRRDNEDDSHNDEINSIQSPDTAAMTADVCIFQVNVRTDSENGNTVS